MAIRISKRFKLNGIKFNSGEIFKFKYRGWHIDPNPLVIVLYKVYGIHPKTGHQHRYIQCINLNYIPRNIRKKFIESWKNKMQSSKNDVFLTWEYVKMRYPRVANSDAVRRYFFLPKYYISNIEKIPMENWEDVVIGSLSKDLSRKMKFSLIRKYRKMNTGNKKKNTNLISKILKKLRD